MDRHSDPRIRAFLAEAAGTFALVFFGTGAIVIDAQTGDLGNVGIGIAFGLVIMSMIYAVGHVSGAHFNPVVTLAFFLQREITPSTAVQFCCAQLFGGVAASYCVRGALGSDAALGMTIPANTVGQAFALEVVLTATLVFVILSVAVGRPESVSLIAAIAIGGTVALGAIVGGPISGASMNPARSIAPALVSGTFVDQWIYVVAPALGAIAGLVAHRAITGSRTATGDVIAPVN